MTMTRMTKTTSKPAADRSAIIGKRRVRVGMLIPFYPWPEIMRVGFLAGIDNGKRMLDIKSNGDTFDVSFENAERAWPAWQTREIPQ